MTKFIYYSLMVFVGLCTLVGFAFLCFSCYFFSEYNYSIAEMGRDAYGFFGGFLMVGLISLTTATMIYLAINKYLKPHINN
jgi:hypothetical protein